MSAHLLIGEKARADDFAGRWREIVSDPLNLLIERHPLSGYVLDGLVYLHNGNRVPIAGPGSYYGDFSRILVINRGVHEPLEEFVFQEALKALPQSPTMLELGAYWGHYSMWLKKRRPDASVHLVEPSPENLDAGKANFERNGFEGEFVLDSVGHGHFSVDAYLQAKGIAHLDVLHGDIQGLEVEMLDDCARSLGRRAIDYLFISTHSAELHVEVTRRLELSGYRVEVSADFDHQTTAFDGFVFASSPSRDRVFGDFRPLGRVDIANSSARDLVLELTRALGDG